MAAELNELQRLAVAQSLYNVVGAAVSTKGGDSMRALLDAEARELYEAAGVKSRDIVMPDGTKVGTYSAKISKAVAESREPHVYVDDFKALSAWLLDNTLLMAGWIERDAVLDDFLQWALSSTGEVPAGCGVTEVVHHARPAQFAGTVLRVDPQAVADALKGELPGVVAGLLGEEVE